MNTNHLFSPQMYKLTSVTIGKHLAHVRDADRTIPEEITVRSYEEALHLFTLIVDGAKGLEDSTTTRHTEAYSLACEAYQFAKELIEKNPDLRHLNTNEHVADFVQTLASFVHSLREPRMLTDRNRHVVVTCIWFFNCLDEAGNHEANTKLPRRENGSR